MLKSYFTIVGLEKPARDDFVALKLFLTAYVLDRLGRFTHAIEVRLVHVLNLISFHLITLLLSKTVYTCLINATLPNADKNAIVN